MIKIGITGQTGFMGTHLTNTLRLYPDKFVQIIFKDEYFQNETLLKQFVSQCEVIIHFAALNRHPDSQVIYNTNVFLVQKLIHACESADVKPHIIFSSSTQEEYNSLYGKSKKYGRRILEKWAKKNEAQFTGLIIPNVYGPFGNPYYNSVVATFCHQLTHHEVPVIVDDAEIKLIYVGELVYLILRKIMDQNPLQSCKTIHIDHTTQIRVSVLLKKLEEYKTSYFEKGIIPNIDNSFDRNLWNTFLSYIDHSIFFPYHLKSATDDRGSFIEVIKLKSGGQISFSKTMSGVTRGNHFHIRKAERFVVIKGKALIELRRIGTDKKLSFYLDGSQPAFVDVPIWFTHNITNIGNEELYTVFWISEHYNPNDSDTYFEEV